MLWMVLDQGEPSVCVKHPGFAVDSSSPPTRPVHALFSGFATLAEAIADDKIRMFGPPKLSKAFGNGSSGARLPAPSESRSATRSAWVAARQS